MSILFRLAVRELKNHRRFSVFFILNLASGLVGLVLVSTLLESVRTSLDNRSQSLLGADLSISMRRPPTIDEEKSIRALLPVGSEESLVLDFFSMLETDSDGGELENRLMQVRAVDERYPFYGGLKLKNGGVLDSAAGLGAQSLESGSIAWVDADTAEDFHLKRGSHLLIGGLKFGLGDFLIEDSTQGLLTLAAAPRVLIPRRALTQKYLDSRGTTLRYSWFFKLPAGADVGVIKKAMEKRIEEPSIRIQTHRESSEGLARLLNYFSDYMALVSLASLSLAALGVVYQFRRYFLSRARSVAVFLSLGATPARALGILAIQLVILAAAGSLLSLGLTALALPVFAKALSPLTVFPIQVQMNMGGALKAIGVGVVLSFLLCLPQLISLKRFNASELFREQTRFEVGASSFFWYWPAFFAFAGLSILYANSFHMGAYFLVGLAVSALCFTLVPWSILKFLDSRSSHWSIETRLALIHLRRNPASTYLVAVCLGLVTLLGGLLPQIRSSMEDEIRGPSGKERPSFFLLDIQPEQLQPLTDLLKKYDVDLNEPSALIRGKLISENGKKATRHLSTASFQTREEEEEAAFRNRGFNLSYREGFSSSETLSSGRPFQGTWDPKSGKVAEISVESRFAKRLGWQMGDEVAFDVAGEAFLGKIVNFRRVRWASFQPNFFVIFQPGVLENAPSVFIGTIPTLSRELARSLGRVIPKEFPNISLIPVEKVLERIYALSEQMLGALLLTTLWVVLAAVLTLYSISRYEAFNRLGDMNLLKVIGATEGSVRRIFAQETLFLSTACAAMGILGGLGLSYVLMHWGMEGAWKPDFLALLLAGGTTVAWMYVQTFFTSGKVWRARPRELLAS